MHTAVHRSTSPRRILIADDEPHIRRILQTVLEMAGFEVDLRRDGTDALAAVRGSEHYDLILLDIMMPGATGLEVLGKIRAMDGRKIHPSRDPHRQGTGRGPASRFLPGGGRLSHQALQPEEAPCPNPRDHRRGLILMYTSRFSLAGSVVVSGQQARRAGRSSYFPWLLTSL